MYLFPSESSYDRKSPGYITQVCTDVSRPKKNITTLQPSKDIRKKIILRHKSHSMTYGKPLM